MRNIAKVVLPVLVLSLILMGCGGGASETKPIDQVKSEAKGMDLKQLQAIIDKYKATIQAKGKELQALQEKMKGIPVVEFLGKEAKAIKVDVEAVSKSIRALTDRLNVYVQELRQKM